MDDELALIETEYRDGRLILRLRGEIDLANVRPMQEQIDRAVAGSDDVALDLSAVDYIDSQGLRLLSQLASRFADEGSEFRLIAPPGCFARGVLDLTRIGEDVEVVDAD
jgi:anti-anti-sigma factor